MSFNSSAEINSDSEIGDSLEVQESLVIDESVTYETDSSDESQGEELTPRGSVTKTKPLAEKDNNRHSDVFQLRKRHVRVLSSDSESGKENQEVNISKPSFNSSKSETGESSQFQDIEQSKQNDSDFQEEDLEKSCASTGSMCETEVEHQPTVSKDKSSRVSQDFRFNSRGILNSTSVHSTMHCYREDEDTSVEILSSSSNVIEVSSEDDSYKPPISPVKSTKKQSSRQQTLHDVVGIPSKKEMMIETVKQELPPAEMNVVTKAQYEMQEARVENAQLAVAKLQSMADGMDLEALPDKGAVVQERLGDLKKRYETENEKLKNMIVSDELQEQNAAAPPNVAWEDIQEGAKAVLPKTFGKTAMSTYNAQKALTMDRLQQLHGALQTCPKEDDFAENPQGLKVSLMPHQKRALAWLLFREQAKPSGGILADDMGLGKTLSIISLILKSAELEGNPNEDEEYTGRDTKHNGGSLIVCPASLINQWSGEIEQRLKRGLLSYYMFHGPKRENSAKKLAKYDVVITTYAIVSVENNNGGVLNRIKWRRVILDEAHQIRNPKTSMSEACCQLLAKSRWALTGTPMHNKELDMFSLLRFLRCTPFDDIQVWKRWVGDKTSGGEERLHTVISSLMLRRTKAELMEKGSLNMMPEKKWILVKVELDKSELRVYHKVLIFSQTLFSQFLHQRAEKNQDYVDNKFSGLPDHVANQEYFKMRQKLLKLNKVKNVSQHEILVLLLRLRQICCHPSLITAMLDEGLEDVEQEMNDTDDHLNLLEQLEKLNLEDETNDDEDEYKPDRPLNLNMSEKVSVKEATRGHLKPSDPVFQKERPSSKIKQMMKVLQEVVLSKDDKAIIVSQWSSYLALVGIHLKNYGINFSQLDGKVPVHKRMEMVTSFNDPKNPMKVLLLSLTAGGVGLNLVGANHLFLLDLHWNPQLESQAQDRIYRMGQTKPVFVYKFMAVDTIEERIKMLQDKKLSMAEAILTGTKQVVQNKLSLQDLKMLFGFDGAH